METLLRRALLRMTGPHEADQFARLRSFRPGPTGDTTPDCLDDDTLAALAEGSLDVARPSALAHVAGCARCRGIVASVARALADPDVATEIRAVEPGHAPRVRRLIPIAAGLAAVAAIMLIIMPPKLTDSTPVHRAPPITAAPAPRTMAPVGRVAAAESLQWTSVAGADRYRVTLFDIDGSVRFASEVTDTSVAVPPSVNLVAGRAYAWRVEARLDFDRWASSDLTEFSIGGREQ